MKNFTIFSYLKQLTTDHYFKKDLKVLLIIILIMSIIGGLLLMYLSESNFIL